MHAQKKLNHLSLQTVAEFFKMFTIFHIIIEPAYNNR